MENTTSDLRAYLKEAIKAQIDLDFAQIPFSFGVKELKEFLPLSDSKIYMMLEAGEIPARKLGGKWVVSKGDFLAWFYESREDLDLAEQVLV